MEESRKLAGLRELEEKARRLASIINAPPECLPRFGHYVDWQAQYFDFDGILYRQVTFERGQPIDDRATLDLNEVLYWIFEAMTFSMASRYELDHRVEGTDSRRLLFEHQLELLGKLNDEWRSRAEQEQQEILKRHPFCDTDVSGPRND